MFESETDQRPCLLDFLMTARRNGEARTRVVEVMGFDRPDNLAGKEVAQEFLEELGPVIFMDGKQFETGLAEEGRKLTEKTLFDQKNFGWAPDILLAMRRGFQAPSKVMHLQLGTRESRLRVGIEFCRGHLATF